MPNNHKIAFIICTNNKILFDECKLYIDKLIIPDGYETELIPVYGAVSMTSGYNSALQKTDAKYKIYMHQDVYIINKYFLCNIIDIFNKDSSIGMIGMIGSPSIPSTTVMWFGARFGNFRSWPLGKRTHERISDDTVVHDVEAIDGFMMVTQFDIPWRSDLFDGWDFYDVSQSFEFRKKGYKVVVPNQLSTWCIHDDGVIMSLWNYDRYREVLISNYSDMVPALDEQDPDYKAYLSIKNYSDNATNMQKMVDDILVKVSDIIGKHNASAFAAICKELGTKGSLIGASSKLTQIQQMGKCVSQEYSMKLKTIIDDVAGEAEFEDKLSMLKLMLRRIELATSDDESDSISSQELDEAFMFIIKRQISPFSIYTVLYSSISVFVEKEAVMLSVALALLDQRDSAGAFLTLSLIPKPSEKTKLLIERLQGKM